ncbi:MAG TPA: heme-dependent peroxidase [Verrucomicrobiales bacterium]|nr:MAG: heme-dependent peroxidase [Verrucomicrobiae bacterium Tous-C3TDCM]PAZ05668.1 MAG: heme-dependent peroxidase [Verrucomicrobiae bacterium AMD-G2]HBE23761.1 heme-dependent peroxidase [Verrucomicrobiales bacterium]
MSTQTTPLIPREGWHVMHLFYQIDHSQWNCHSQEEKRTAKTNLTELVQEIRSTKDTHLLTFSIATPKADIGFMLLTPDLQIANAFEKRLSLSLGPDILNPCYSYLSQTESSEYTTTSEEYIKQTLIGEKGLTEGSPEFLTALEEFEERMTHYLKHRLYPVLPDWPIVCFYPMSKRRNGNDNWYSLNFDARRELMSGHARVGRTYAGRILQLITGSTGLDEHEWGVTLLAKDTIDIKAIVYEMRFDEVSARFGEFGDFYIGMQLPLDELFRRVCL